MSVVESTTKTKYLTIDTRFRDKYDSSCVANYNITLPERINNVKSMRVTNVEIPVSYYNISANIGNNAFYFKQSDKFVDIIVPDGNYDETTLIETVNTAIPFATIVFSIENHRGVFTNNDLVGECIIGFNLSQNPTIQTGVLSTFGWLLGYRKSLYTLALNAKIASESFAMLTGPRYLFLVVDEFTNGNPHSFLSLSRTSELSSQQILARITTGINPFGTVLVADTYSNCCSDTRIYSNEVNIQRLNVKLVDELGTIVDLNGMDLSFCLELQHL